MSRRSTDTDRTPTTILRGRRWAMMAVASTVVLVPLAAGAMEDSTIGHGSPVVAEAIAPETTTTLSLAQQRARSAEAAEKRQAKADALAAAKAEAARQDKVADRLTAETERRVQNLGNTKTLAEDVEARKALEKAIEDQQTLDAFKQAVADRDAAEAKAKADAEAQAQAEAKAAAEAQAAAAAQGSAAPAVASGSVWDQLAQCEAGGNWAINTGNGYYGGLQFSASSWQAVGGTGLPHQASREVQIQMGERLRAAQGWGAWPACSRKLGLR